MSSNERIEEILKQRYYLPGETSWEDICRRVSNYIGNTDEERAAYFEIMKTKEFIPNSPCLFNAGTKQPLMSACFAIGIDDSMESIYNALYKSAILFKLGAGVGFNFSKIRPEGSPVGSTQGVASGVLSFIRVFNESIDVIKQAGRRRGAAIAILNCDHPEIESFIKSKTIDGKLTNFNISVLITDDFINAIEKDKMWDLKFNGQVYKTLPARDLFQLMYESTWKYGDPGYLYEGNINRDNPNLHLGRIETTNPCVSGDTLILTKSGYKKISECVNKNTTIWNGFEWSDVMPRITGENKELYEISFSNGSILQCTDDHTFVTCTGNPRDTTVIKKQTKDLLIGDKIQKFNLPVIENGDKTIKNPYTQGFFSGDGYLKHKKEPCAWLYGEKINLVNTLSINNYKYNEKLNRCHVKLDIDILDKNFVPTGNYTIDTKLKWLSGIIDSDGNKNCKEGCLQICSINRKFLQKIQYLLNELGAHSRLSICKPPTTKLMPDNNGGNKYYNCKTLYRLSISPNNTKKLIDIGLKTHRVIIEPTPNRDASQFITVTDIRKTDVIAKKVYCLTEPKNNTFVANGVIIGNCGEIPILTDHKTGGGESCNLGSIDVSKFLVDGKFDYKRLEKTIRLATRFLNSVIYKNAYPFKEIEELTKKTAKIGLGIMGWADLLILQKIPYDSEEARKLATTLMKTINDIAINESMKIASETQVYPAWEGSEWEKKQIPIANSTLTCQAPTGTISMIADCSSGIEPVIAFVHKRKNCIGKEYFIVHRIFEKCLKEECEKYNKSYEDVIKHCYTHGTIQDIDWISNDFKSIFRSSLDIHWRDHLLMQAAFQKSVGNSISKTINAKQDIPVEDVRDAILMAWKLGCKGFTLYRIGSKSNEVISLAEPTQQEDDGSMNDIPNERPDVLFGATYVSQSGCGKLYTVINYLDGKPYEVFVFSGGSGGCQAQNEGVGRLASLLLRNGVDYNKVVKQLKKVKCPVAMKNQRSHGKSCSDIIGTILSKSMGDDTESQDQQKTLSPRAGRVIKSTTNNTNSGNPCPECGEPLEFGEGCNNGTCPSCGWSGCQ